MNHILTTHNHSRSILSKFDTCIFNLNHLIENNSQLLDLFPKNNKHTNIIGYFKSDFGSFEFNTSKLHPMSFRTLETKKTNKNEINNSENLRGIEEHLKGLKEHIYRNNEDNTKELAKEIQVLAKTVSLIKK